MITIRPSTIADDAASSPASDVSDQEEHKKRIPLVWIPATLGVGLLIAALYLRGRIVLTHPPAKPAIVQQLAPVPAPLPPAPVAATATSDPPPPAPEFVGPQLPSTVGGNYGATGEYGIPTITPGRGELYIQVGALNPEATRRMLARLRGEKLDPHVAPGPRPELLRVLIGPFDNRDALNERKAQLEAEGVDTFVRQY